MEQSDDVCPRCGKPAEQGHISWNGYPIYWSPTERKKWLGLSYTPKEPLIPHDGFKRPTAPARRCTACRTLWVHY